MSDTTDNRFYREKQDPPTSNERVITHLLREQAEGVRINAKFLNQQARKRQLEDSSRLMREVADEIERLQRALEESQQQVEFYASAAKSSAHEPKAQYVPGNHASAACDAAFERACKTNRAAAETLRPAMLAILEAGWRAAQPPCAWQPIETAPKDGTVVYLYAEVGDWKVRGHGYWEGAGIVSGWITNGFYDPPGNLGLAHPTHWQPIPPPPTKEVGPPMDTPVEGVPGMTIGDFMRASVDIARQTKFSCRVSGSACVKSSPDCQRAGQCTASGE